MSAYQTYTPRAFYRSADRAVLGGVCAGLADYFGFNLRVLRFLAIIAFVVRHADDGDCLPCSSVLHSCKIWYRPGAGASSPS